MTAKTCNLEKPNHVNVVEGEERSAEGTVHVLVYHIDEQRYGLFLCDVDKVVRAVAITPLLDAPTAVMGIINVRGRVIPVVNMRRKLQLPERDVELNDQFVIARTTKRTVALVVDWVEGVIERPGTEVIRGEEIVAGLENLKGVIRLPDGLILIHNLDRFLFRDEEEGLGETLSDD